MSGRIVSLQHRATALQVSVPAALRTLARLSLLQSLPLSPQYPFVQPQDRALSYHGMRCTQRCSASSDRFEGECNRRAAHPCTPAIAQKPSLITTKSLCAAPLLRLRSVIPRHEHALHTIRAGSMLHLTWGSDVCLRPASSRGWPLNRIRACGGGSVFMYWFCGECGSGSE